MRSFPSIFCILLLALLPIQSARASLVITSTVGTTHEADQFSTFATSSAQMVGMEVTLFFDDGSSDTGVWTTTGINQNGWVMTQGPGSTFNNPFTLTNNSSNVITRFTMHGAGSTTLFDRSVNPSTPGTANGRDLQEFTFLRFSQDIVVTYFDAIRFGATSPVGDIYAGMDVDFSAGISTGGGVFRFRTDTDNTIDSIQAVIPEPTTAMQMGILLTGMMLRRRRKLSKLANAKQA